MRLRAWDKAGGDWAEEAWTLSSPPDLCAVIVLPSHEPLKPKSGRPRALDALRGHAYYSGAEHQHAVEADDRERVGLQRQCALAAAQ